MSVGGRRGVPPGVTPGRASGEELIGGLLGNNAATADEAGLFELELILRKLGTPAVMVAGLREMTPESGDQFLRG